jgi:NADPH-dependent ferric siderophore reductase
VADEIDAIPTHITSVVRNEALGPWYRRITFAGGDLVHYSAIAPDEFVYLLLPPPGRTELTIDASFSWTAYYGMGPDEQPVGAYYTVRSFRPDVAELDIDVFLHEVAGHASGWARRAAPGDPVALWGPRTAFHPPGAGVDVDWWLLVADESGLPALAAILEWLPVDAEVRAFVEVPSAGEVPTIPAGVTVLERGDAAAGTTTQLADAVRALDRPEGRPYVWGGGESRSMTAIRKYVRHELGYERAMVSLTAYWRHQAHAADPDDEEDA